MLRANNISVQFGGKFLFQDITFQVGDKERIGLTGKNGAGKSTLLKIISGYQGSDSGTVETSGGYTIGYLPQDIDIQSDLSVLEETKKAFSEVEKIEAILPESEKNSQKDTQEKDESEDSQTKDEQVGRNLLD